MERFLQGFTSCHLYNFFSSSSYSLIDEVTEAHLFIVLWDIQYPFSPKESPHSVDGGVYISSSTSLGFTPTRPIDSTRVRVLFGGLVAPPPPNSEFNFFGLEAAEDNQSSAASASLDCSGDSFSGYEMSLSHFPAPRDCRGRLH